VDDQNQANVLTRTVRFFSKRFCAKHFSYTALLHWRDIFCARLTDMTAHKLLPYFFFPTTWIVLLLIAATVLLWRNKARPAFTALLAATVFTVMFASPRVADFLWQSLESTYPPQPINALHASDAIVLLGGGVELPAPPRLMPDLNDSADRLWLAAELYHAGKAPLIVVSGGQVFPQPGLKSEAEYHAMLLERMGVPRDAIVLETQSRNTQENAEFVARLLQQRGLKRILLTTSAIHMPRSMLLFSQTGLEVEPAVCDIRVAPLQRPWLLGILPSAQALSLSEGAIREWMGYLFYRVKAT